MLQQKLIEGKGAIATMNLTTIANDWWGIDAGQVFEVTFIYLSRLSAWESQLSPIMQKLVVPKDSDDLTNTVNHGPFRNFPHYETLGGMIDYERANLLADMTGWLVQENADIFRNIIRPA